MFPRRARRSFMRRRVPVARLAAAQAAVAEEQAKAVKK
jgi:hypothetical protein